MSLNGAGVFSVNSAGQPVVGATLIQASVFNAFTADVATALSTAIYRDGQAAYTANQAMGGFKHTGAGAATASGQYLMYDQSNASLTSLSIGGSAAVSGQTLQSQLYTAFTTGGSNTAYTLTPTPASAANAANQRFRVAFHAASGATPTLSVSGQTAKSLKYKDSTGTKQEVTSTQITANWIADVEYDGTDWVVLNVPPTVTETGTINWTDGSGQGLIFTGMLGRYERRGNVCSVWGELTYPGGGSGALDAQINGMPFVAAQDAATTLLDNSGLANSAITIAAGYIAIFQQGTFTRRKNSALNGAKVIFSVTFRVA